MIPITREKFTNKKPAFIDIRYWFCVAISSPQSTPWSSYVPKKLGTVQWEKWNRHARWLRGSQVRSKSTGRSKSNRRLLPRNSAWFNLAGNSGWKTWYASRRPARFPQERTIPRFRSNESIDKFGVSPHPVAALSLAVTFRVQRSPSFPIRFAPAKDKGHLCAPPHCNLASPAGLRRDKQFSVFLRLPKVNRRPVVYPPQVSNYFTISRRCRRW